MKFLSNLGSWKTKLAGVGLVCAAVGMVLPPLFDGDSKTSVNWTEAFIAFTTGCGLLAARQNDVSSEQVAANKGKPLTMMADDGTPVRRAEAVEKPQSHRGAEDGIR